ncbi:MAG: acyl-CoA dehydrogenase family protein [Phycisphaerales bacterium]|nr:acyl-CoA dehydrogenase family protein [Phycisphaerales bacterium]
MSETEQKSLASKITKLSEKDIKQIAEAEEMLGPDPDTLGIAKNYAWGRLREDLLFPYPERDADEIARCDQMLAALDEYLTNEHPTNEIDQNEEIPDWVFKRLFEIGVLGMTIPTEYGGAGLGITSYNKILERIGRTDGSTAVVVSAHQSIGCKALMLYGTEEQKKEYLPRLANDCLSAFCLSEPDVGCDAGGQQTRIEVSEDGEYYILNGEKKWATSGAMSGLFTIMGKQKIKSPKTGKEKDRVTALILTPDMEGVDIFSRNRSKSAIRGTWQARVRFTNVKIPRKNLLHKEGKGLALALTCLNYGRCTLAAGMLGAARAAMDQATKWAQTRHQFKRPLAEFDLVKQRIARMHAYSYAMDAMLYMTTGMLDRHDDDIMLETALAKVFCSELGWEVANDAMLIMGGEGFMVENGLERIHRDARIYTIVEGANDVMHPFVFGYGTKDMTLQMTEVKEHPFKHIGFGMQLGAELFMGIRRSAPPAAKLHPKLAAQAHQLSKMIRDYSFWARMMMKEHDEYLFEKQSIQARLSWNVVWIHAVACTLSKLDVALRKGDGGDELDYEMKVATHFCNIAHYEFERNVRALRENPDDTQGAAAAVALKLSDSMPNSLFAIPESSPIAKGTGRELKQDGIKQFGAGSTLNVEATG